MRASSAVRRLLALGAVAALATGALTGCFGARPDVVVNAYVSGFSVPADADSVDLLVTEQLEAGSDEGPAAVVESAATVVNGGSIQQSITADREFSGIRIAVEPLVDADGEPVDVTGTPGFGYWESTLSAPATEATVIVTVPQALPNQEFVAYFALVDDAGVQGVPVAQDVEALAVGTGDVQVSVSWDVDSDLDLHVVAPGGEEIYWESPQSSTGGVLDLDSNAGCEIDGVRNENVTWATGEAPPGEYKVLVDLWDACGVQPTSYVVTVTVAGGATQTYTGSVDGAGSQGGAGAGELIATFEVPEAG